uniref:Uncharacterized protein TCIL3000_7_6000 n=1 Tax=Trypanosoma congolense (strain IL3000) TaxID=1068625 RepID=G0UQX6_TRYCI|nr:unnamed protein product [Trypanosoma congolense IL3000]
MHSTAWTIHSPTTLSQSALIDPSTAALAEVVLETSESSSALRRASSSALRRACSSEAMHSTAWTIHSLTTLSQSALIDPSTAALGEVVLETSESSSALRPSFSSALRRASSSALRRASSSALRRASSSALRRACSSEVMHASAWTIHSPLRYHKAH